MPPDPATATAIAAGGSQAAGGGANIFTDVARNRAERRARGNTLELTQRLTKEAYRGSLRDTQLRFFQEQERGADEIRQMSNQGRIASGRLLAAAGASGLAGASVASAFSRHEATALLGEDTIGRNVAFMRLQLDAEREAARRRALESIWGAAGNYIKPPDYFGGIGQIGKGAAQVGAAI